MSSDKKSILVIMTDKHMGNLVVSIPAIKALKDFFSDRPFYLIIDSAYKEIVETFIDSDHLILFPRRQFKSMPALRRFFAYSEFIKRIRNIRPEMAIDLEGRQASATFAYLSGAAVRIGSASAERPYLYSKKIRITPDRHRVWSYLEISSSVGLTVKEIDFSLPVSWQKLSSIEEKLRDMGVNNAKEPFVCIHPGAGKIYKQWPLARFAEIADWLVDEGFKVFLIGGGSDIENVQAVQSMMRNHAFSLANKLSLGELMALFRLSLAYIGNDSGPLHLAAATGLPVIGLFGPANENRWGPLGRRSVVLRGAERCSKCKGRDCRYDYRCIKELETESVRKAVEALVFKDAEHLQRREHKG